MGYILGAIIFTLGKAAQNNRHAFSTSGGLCAPVFFCAYCQLIMPRPDARAPCQTYRPARTMQDGPPAAGQSTHQPPDNRPTSRRTLTPDRGPDAKTQYLGAGSMRCRTTYSVSRTADRGPRTPDRQKTRGARCHRVIFSGQKTAVFGQIFAARGVAARVLVPCSSQIIT